MKREFYLLCTLCAFIGMQGTEESRIETKENPTETPESPVNKRTGPRNCTPEGCMLYSIAQKKQQPVSQEQPVPQEQPVAQPLSPEIPISYSPPVAMPNLEPEALELDNDSEQLK